MSPFLARAGRPHRRLTTIVCLLFLLAAGSGLAPGLAKAQSLPPAAGQPDTAGSDVRPDAGALAGLERQARAAGEVRVIVGLGVPTRLEGALAPTERRGQREAIARARSALIAAEPGLRVNRAYDTLSYLALTVSAEELQRLADRPDVTSITPDAIGDPALDTSTALVGAPQMWRAGLRGTGYAVAVLDTGISYRHVAFDSARIPASACFSSTGPQVASLCANGASEDFSARAAADCPLAVTGCGHGTHVSAIAAGAQGRSFRGVAPAADIIPIKIFSRFEGSADCGNAPPCARYYYSDLIAGLEHVLLLADTHPIAAVNMSLQGGIFTEACGTFLPAFSTAAANLLSRGIIPVAATGNSYRRGAFAHPACDPSVVAVIATDNGDAVADFSNLNDTGMILAAPGVGIEAAYPPGLRHRAALSGTSMASPHVAGAIALLRQARPHASSRAIFRALHCTGTTVAPQDFAAEFRRINIRDALTQLRRQSLC